MQKIVFTDKTEFEILEGASLGSITVLCEDFTALGKFTTALKKKGNLDSVQFKQDEQVTGEYEKMLLASATYFNVDIDEANKVLASFSLREKTETEKQIEALSQRADVTEAALQEVILKQEVQIMARFLAMRIKMGHLRLEEIQEPLRQEVGKVLEEMN